MAFAMDDVLIVVWRYTILGCTEEGFALPVGTQAVSVVVEQDKLLIAFGLGAEGNRDDAEHASQEVGWLHWIAGGSGLRRAPLTGWCCHYASRGFLPVKKC